MKIQPPAPAQQPPLASTWVELEPDLRRFIHRHLGRGLAAWTDVDDVVQEVWLRTRGSGPLTPARLRHLARWVIADLGRRRRFEHSRQEIEFEDVTAPDNEDPAERCARTEERARLSSAFRSLGVQDRELIRSRLDGELHWRANVRRLGCSPGAARVRLARARQRLAQQLVQPA